LGRVHPPTPMVTTMMVRVKAIAIDALLMACLL
jgi:hypothetical protein